jgi:hypothetical protein
MPTPKNEDELRAIKNEEEQQRNRELKEKKERDLRMAQ